MGNVEANNCVRYSLQQTTGSTDHLPSLLQTMLIELLVALIANVGLHVTLTTVANTTILVFHSAFGMFSDLQTKPDRHHIALFFNED